MHDVRSNVISKNQHTHRMAKAVVIRKTLSTHKELPNCIEQFDLPETLKPYEVEIDIRAIAANFAVGRYIDRVHTMHVCIQVPTPVIMNICVQL